ITSPLRGFVDLAGIHRLIQEFEISLTLFEIGIDPSLAFCLSRWPCSLRLSREHCRRHQYASANDLQYHSHRHGSSFLSYFRFQFRLRIVSLLVGRVVFSTSPS